MKRIFTSALFLFLFLLAANLHADTKVWTGLSTNLPPRWDDPDNWKPGPPGELDDVVIGEPPYSSQAHITVQGPIKLKSLLMNRTTLIGPAQIEVTSLVSKGAALTVGGAIKVTGAASILPGPTGEYGLLVDGWTVNNEGAMSISTNATFKFFSGAGQLNNTGTIDLADTSSIDGLGANGSQFINSGIIRKAQGLGRATINAVPFANNGQVLVSAGKLSFPSGQVLNTGQMTIQGSANSIVFEGASLDLSGGALTGDGEYVVRASSVVTVNVDTPIDILNLSSDITGPAKLTVQAHLIWTAGVMSGGGETISVTQLDIEDPPGGATRRINGRTLRNKLYALWKSGDITVTGGGRIENELTAEFTIGDLADKQLAGSYLDTGGFFNAGVVKLVKENGRKTSFYCPLSNSSRFEYASQLLLYGGGTHSGTFVQVGDPAFGKLDFLSGTNNFEQGFTSVSTNLVSIKGATVQVRGASKANRLELNGGTLTGPADLEVSELFLWTSGDIRGTGILRTLPSATFDWGTLGAAREVFKRTLEIGGVGLWNQINFSTSDGATIRILPTGELRAGAAESMQWNTGAVPTLENNGRFTKQTGTGTAYIGVNFINRGSVVVNQGKIQFANGSIQEAGSTQIDTGAEVQASKGFTNLINAEILGGGRLSGGTTNYGKIRPGSSPGILTMTDLRQGSSGILEIEINGRQPATEFDQLTIENVAVLDGELRIKRPTGFVPNVGDRFDILTFQSRLGQFKIKSGDIINNYNLAFVPEYTATKVTLVVTAITPELPTLTNVGPGSGHNRIWSWPATSGKQYQVEYTSDFNAWSVFTNVTANSSSILMEMPAPIAPEQMRFYRLR